MSLPASASAASAKRSHAVASAPAAAGSPNGVADDAYVHEATWFEATPFCAQDQPPDLPTLRADVLQLATHTRPFIVSGAKAIGQLFDQSSATNHQLQVLRDDMQTMAGVMSQEVKDIKEGLDMVTSEGKSSKAILKETIKD